MEKFTLPKLLNMKELMGHLADKGFIMSKECMLQKKEGSGFVLRDLTYRRPDGGGENPHQK